MNAEQIIKLQYTETDAKQFERGAILSNAIIIISLYLFAFDILPLIILFIILSIYITRWMICVHELFHIYSADKVSPLIRLILIPFTPLNIGYHEYRAIHKGHHKYNALVEDPEAFHIRCSHLYSLIMAMMYPEQSFFRYVKANKLSLSQWREVLIRLILFLLLFWLFNLKFMFFWLILRFLYGINTWIFFHWLHVEKDQYGVFPLPLPLPLQRVYKLFYGDHSLQATMHHDIHHRWPRVAYWNLSKLRTAIISS